MRDTEPALHAAAMRTGGRLASKFLTSERMVAVMTADRSATWATCIAVCIGLVYAMHLLGWSGLSGTGRFWLWPNAAMGASLDIRNSLSGYWWFIQDKWRWPLLALPRPNWPTGANAELFDVVPAVAIFGKLLHSLAGWKINLYPTWLIGCFTLNSVAFVALVRSLGQRSLLAASLAACFGAMAPVVVYRFGHLALMAHWLPLAALAIYIHTRSSRLSACTVGSVVGLCLLASCVHLYLYVMTAAIAVAVCLQAMLDRRVPMSAGIIWSAMILLAGVLPLWAFGLFGWHLTEVHGDVSRYSMNALSPFWPQFSGLFGWTKIYWLTRGSIGATSGQYDGFDYLGFGLLLLLIPALFYHPVTAPKFGFATIKRHPVLTLTLTALTIWALSDRIYLGPYLIVSYQPPRLLETTVFAWFRSSGRFFWPVGWLLSGFAIARALTVLPPGLACSAAALALLAQWIDGAPLRQHFEATIRHPVSTVFGDDRSAARVADVIQRVGAVIVVPPIFCSSAGADFGAPLNAGAMEVQLMAARAGARMGSVYLSRMPQHCETPQVSAPPLVIVRLKDKGDAALQPDLTSGSCFDTALARVCTYP